jgi:hypothetical protein
MLGGGAVSWKSRRQHYVSLSTSKAGYVSGCAKRELLLFAFNRVVNVSRVHVHGVHHLFSHVCGPGAGRDRTFTKPNVNIEKLIIFSYVNVRFSEER